MLDPRFHLLGIGRLTAEPVDLVHPASGLRDCREVEVATLTAPTDVDQENDETGPDDAQAVGQSHQARNDTGGKRRARRSAMAVSLDSRLELVPLRSKRLGASPLAWPALLARTPATFVRGAVFATRI